MTIRVNAPFSISDNLQALIDEKVGKLDNYFERIQSTEVFLKDQENRSNNAPKGETVEIRMYVPGHTLYADASAESFEKALADAADKMRRQIIKYKEQLNSH